MKKHYTVGLIFIIGITISLIAFWAVKHQLNIHRNLEFKWTASEHYRAFYKQLKSDLYALELHKTLDNFQLQKQKDFSNFSTIILKQHKSIKSLYWLPADTIDILNSRSNQDTNPLFPIVTAQSDDKYLHALSSDPIFISNFNKALQQARDTGNLTISEYIVATADNKNLSSIIGISPIYKPVMPINTLLQKRQNLTGFVVGIVLLSDLFKVSIGDLEPRGIDIYLFKQSVTMEKHVLFSYKSRVHKGDDSNHHQTDNYSINNTLTLIKRFTIADKNLLFIGNAIPEFRSAEAFTQGPIIALMTGLLITLFLVVYFHHLSHTRDAWQAAERKLHTILDHSPDHILILDINGLILYMNKSLFSLEHTTSIGQNFFDLLPSEYLMRYKKGLIKVFEENSTDLFNYSLEDSSHWEVRIIPIKIKNKINSVMVINTDITQQHKLQIQTVENARLASIGVLATGIAHEINNPNNSIYYNASLVQDSWNDILPILEEYLQDNGDFSMGGLPFSQTKEKIISACSSMIENTTRIQKIVANLKSFGRKNDGEINKDIQIIDVIDDSLLIINNEVRKHTDSISLDLPNNLPKIRGNAQKLEQVFINIILNALHALPGKDKGLHISANYDNIGESIHVSVKDEGIGIDENSIDKITQPFYTTKPDHIGTGLGLSISNSIIKEHHGKLRIESKLQQGTTVTIIIPVNHRQ